MRQDYIINPDGTFKRLANALVYVRFLVARSLVSCERIIIQACPDSAMVVYCLSDGRIAFSEWASYIVALEYFTRRSRTFKGTPIVRK